MRFHPASPSTRCPGGVLHGWAWVAVLLLLLIFGSAAPAKAATEVSGTILSDQRWTTAGAPYIVVADLLVDGAATLSIEPGVTVFFGAGRSLRVGSGQLSASGSIENPIRFLSDRSRLGQPATAGDWARIELLPGSSGSRLRHVLVEHGQGLRVLGSAPSIDFVEIRNNAGPAIEVDLAASPAGVGNRASGNQLDGVLVPAGDITGTVRWGLRGIPYIVQQGVVSVGVSPRVLTLDPSSIEVGSTREVTLSGVRLAGASDIRFAASGVSVAPQPGASDSRLVLSVTAAEDASLGATSLSMMTDAGEVVLPAALIVRPRAPRLTRVTPDAVLVGRGATTLQIEGANLRQDTVAEIDGVPIPTSVNSTSQATATLPEQTQAGVRSLRLRTPDPAQPGNSMLTDALPIAVTLPTPALAPNPVSMFQGNTQVMTMTLPFAAPPEGLVFSLASSAPLVVGVQDSVRVTAGATSVQFDIRGAGIGSAVVTASRSGWASAQIPVTVVEPPRRIDLTPIVSRLVGVQVGPAATPSPSTATQPALPVGVVVGSSATRLTPRAIVVGTIAFLEIRGTGLNAVSAVRAIPGDGLSFSTPLGSLDGRSLTVPVVVADDAPKTQRRIVLEVPGGEVVFMNPAESLVLVTSPPPILESITPQVVVAGAPPVVLTVRGRNFRDVSGVRFEPATGLVALGQPTVSADGTTLTTTVQADAAAASGSRTMVVSAAAGESDAVPVPANTVQLARSAGARFESIASATVGVQVGAVTPVPPPSAVVQAQAVGVAFGSAVTSMQPKEATRGESFLLRFRGVGLQAVTSVSFTPATGITVGNPTASADGRELEVPVAIDFNAPDTLREVRLETAAVPIPFAVAGDNQFRVRLIVGTRFESLASSVVGVQVGTPASTPVPVATLGAMPLGVVVGAAAQSMSPSVGVVGTSLELVVDGVGLGAVTAVAAVPGDGLTFGPVNVAADGRRLRVTATVANDAAKTTRRIQLRTAAGEVPFFNLLTSQFLITAPVPVLESITPQVVVAGAAPVKLTVRGTNFRDITGVRFEPAAGLSAQGTPTFNAEGSVLEVTVQAAADASSGPRTMVVTSAAGDSSAVPAAGNSVQVARSAGTRFESIASSPVGLQVGPVGVVAASQATVAAQATGVVVGAAITGMTPSGTVKDSQGNWEFSGHGLGAVTGVQLVAPNGAVNPADSGVTIGAISGTSVITVPYAISASAPSRIYRVELLAGGAVVPLARLGLNLWEVLDAPRIDSVSPVTLRQGSSYSFQVRGQNLSRVQEIRFEPAGGLQVASQPTWGSDQFGEFLNVQLLVAPDATVAPRVVRLRTAAGLTTASPSSANVVSVVP